MPPPQPLPPLVGSSARHSAGSAYPPQAPAPQLARRSAPTAAGGPAGLVSTSFPSSGKSYNERRVTHI